MEVVNELFKTEDLYEILGVDKEKSDDEKALRSAYLKAALKYHPDKAPAKERETFTKKFQVLKKIYEILQDKDLKKIYDDTGAWPEDEKFEMDIASFARLDVNAILEFQKMYQGSEEERQDIKKFYVEGKGDLGHICDNVFFLNILDDEERVNSIIESLIEAKEVERLSTGKKNEKALERKKKKAEKEAQEAEKIMKERNLGGGLGDLQKAIARNNAARGNFLDDLAAKYGGAESSSKRNAKKKADALDDGPGSNTKKARISKLTGESSRATRSRSSK